MHIAVATQHTKSSSPTATNQKAPTVAGTDATNKSYKQSIVTVRGRNGAPFSADTATIDAHKRAGTSSHDPSPRSSRLSQPRGPGVLSPEVTWTKSSAASPTRGSTQPRIQCPLVAPVPGKQGDDCVRPSIDAIPQQDFSSPAQGNTVEINERGKDLARRCWEEDNEFLAKDKVAEWLSEQNPINEAALWHYLQYFDFVGLRLDDAFRQLCKKLYLKAETQQVDRILDVFGKRYRECNPDSVFGSANVAHVVSYSLVQLNTDLHITESASKMSRDQFVDHTMDSIQTHLQPKVSDGDRSSVKDGQGTSHGTSSFPLPLAVEASSQQVGPSSLSSRADALLRTNGSDTPNGQESTSEIPASIVLDEERRRQLIMTLKDIYNATKKKRIEINAAGVVTPPTPSPDETLPDTKKPIGFASIFAQTTLRENPSDDEQSGPRKEGVPKNGEITDEKPALLGPPWAKEGMLNHRYYKKSPEKGAKSGGWMDAFAVAWKDGLLMFKFGSHDAESDGLVGDGKWWEHAKSVGQLPLIHSYAQARPPGDTNQRPSCMVLMLADGSVYFFQAGTDELVKEWVSTCNYWAARRSKVPLAEGHTNVEYGWGPVSSTSESGNATSNSPSAKSDAGRSRIPFWNRGQSRTMRSVHEWEPPMSPTTASTRDEEGQLKAVENHASLLETKLEAHFKLLQTMKESHKSRPRNALKAQDNWRKRANYLQVEVVKYRLYSESLRSVMKLRPEALEKAAIDELPVPAA